MNIWQNKRSAFASLGSYSFGLLLCERERKRRIHLIRQCDGILYSSDDSCNRANGGSDEATSERHRAHQKTCAVTGDERRRMHGQFIQRALRDSMQIER